jgi:hydroxylamine reductase
MKQIIQDLKKGDTILEEVPAPRVKAGSVLIRTSRSLVSLGTERMLIDFGKANFLEKAKQQPDKVKAVLEKVKTDGIFKTFEVVRSKLDQPLSIGYSNAGVILDNIKSGALQHIFYVGGCDGTEHVRSYFGDLAKVSPENSLILTSGCGKFRLHDLELGTLGDSGIPRILDLGQCNDAYSAVVVAMKLAEALDCTIHDLPLHFAVSWFEQKAVAVFLSLLHLGIKNIRLGPALPAFLTPDVRDYLFQNLGVRQINAQDEKADMEAFLSE